MWIDDNLIDLTMRSPGADLRPLRSSTDFVTVHRIKYGAEGDASTWLDQIINFFTEDPEGIAVTQIGGSYRSKLPTIAKWREEGVPDENLKRAFVAYQIIVDPDGYPHKMLPLDAKGAHASPNSRAMAVAFVGDFRELDELAPWEIRAGDKGRDSLTEAQKRTGRFLFRDLLVRYPGAEVVTHDDTLRARRLEPKHCPGSRAIADVDDMRAWAELAASTMRKAPEDR